MQSNIVSSGSGLYNNGDGTYIFKGFPTNNYIILYDDLWRIMEINNYGIKIVKVNGLSIAYDESGYRDSDSDGSAGTYCTQHAYGCNAWAATANLIGSPELFVNGSYSGTVLKDSSSNIYLNGDFYINNLHKNPNIVDGVFNVGTNGNEEAYQWRGKIAIISKSDYNKSYLDNLASSYPYSYLGSLSCNNRTMFASHESTSDTIIGVICPMSNPLTYASMSMTILPVLYLNSNVTFNGEGTIDSPYTIPE